MLTEVSTDAAGQARVSHAEAAQRAFTTAPEASVTLLPSAAQPEAELTAAVTIASLVHVQVEVEAQSKRNSVLQAKIELAPALSVLTSNLISTLEPSLLNAADVRTGAGRGALAGSTAKLRPLPAGYCTSYWYADCPETVTL
jgi:hypothetical protein